MGAFAWQGVLFIASNSQTMDEAVHLAAGYSYLARKDFRLNPEHPPLVKWLAALPVYLWYRLPFEPDPLEWRDAKQGLIAHRFLYGSAVGADQLLGLARASNLALGVTLVGLVGWWGYRLWGRSGGLVAMTLAALDPNLVAHSSLVTTDLALALFASLTFYLLWEYADRRSLASLGGAGISLGLAMASKYSALLVLLIVPLAVGCHLLCGGSFSFLRSRSHSEAGRVADAALPTVLVVAVAVVLVPAAYFFRDASTWWAGALMVRKHQRLGHPAFLLGQYSAMGWPHYFLVALLVKTPLGTLVPAIVSLALWRRGARFRCRESAFILLPLAAFLLAATGSHINIGVRHVLNVYPFLFLVASRMATFVGRRRWTVPSAVGLCLACTAVSSLRVAPHQLAYFNELVGGPASGYRYLSDSNVDWGQDLKGVKAFMDREGLPAIYFSYFGNAPPEYYGIRHYPVPGFGPARPSRPLAAPPANLERLVLAISVTNLQGVLLEDRDLYHWLYQRRPVAFIGYSILVYDLTRDAEGLGRLAAVRARFDERLCQAVRERQAQKVAHSLNRGADANARCAADGGAGPVPALTPLMVATTIGDTASMETLLDGGAEVNRASDDGRNALRIAVERGHAEAVALLVRAGADPKEVAGLNGEGLRWAVSQGDREGVRRLIDEARHRGLLRQ